MERVEEVILALDGITKKKFHELSRQYARETAVLSFTQWSNPAYMELASMGERIVPWLLEDLNSAFKTGTVSEFDPWAHFSLLRQVLGGRGPIIEEKDRGRLKPLVKAWVNWGKEEGLI